MNKNNIVNRLSHFVPTTYQNENQYDSMSNVVSLALYRVNCAMTMEEIVNFIFEEIGIKVHSSHVEESLNYLMEIGIISIVIDKYILNQTEKNNMKMAIEAEYNLEEKVLSDWISKLKEKYEEYDEEDFNNIKVDFSNFLKKLFITHGLESLSLINSEIENDSIDISIKSIIDKLNAEIPTYKEFRISEYHNFFNLIDSERELYLIRMVDKALRYLVLVCDPNILDKIKERLNGKIVYLDSSVVYRLVNLQGRKREKIIRDVVDLCNEFNITLKISKMTLLELQRRISYDSSILKRYNIPVSFQKIGYSFSTSENFITTYWYEASKEGISVDDFINHYKSIDIILESEGIIVERDHPENHDNIVLEASKNSSKMRSIVERCDRDKSDNALAHDCYMLELIKNSRNDCNTNFIDCGVWFLTTDHMILKTQDVFPEISINNLPLAILPSHLLQLLRFVRAKDDKFDEMFIDVFSTSTTFSSVNLSPYVIQEILGRLSKYSKSPRLAERILTNAVFTRKFESIEQSEEREELIHEIFEDEYERLETEYEKNKSLLISKHQEVIAKDSEVLQLANRIEDISVEFVNLEEKYNNTENDLVSEKKETTKIKEILTKAGKAILLLIIVFFLMAILKYFLGWEDSKFIDFFETIIVALILGIFAYIAKIIGIDLSSVVKLFQKNEE